MGKIRIIVDIVKVPNYDTNCFACVTCEEQLSKEERQKACCSRGEKNCNHAPCPGSSLFLEVAIRHDSSVFLETSDRRRGIAQVTAVPEPASLVVESFRLDGRGQDKTTPPLRSREGTRLSTLNRMSPRPGQARRHFPITFQANLQFRE